MPLQDCTDFPISESLLPLGRATLTPGQHFQQPQRAEGQEDPLEGRQLLGGSAGGWDRPQCEGCSVGSPPSVPAFQALDLVIISYFLGTGQVLSIAACYITLNLSNKRNLSPQWRQR